MTRLAFLIATWFGCGYFPAGPGTVGSLAAVAIAFLLHQYFQWSGLALLLLAVILLWPSIWAASRVARAIAKEDPGLVVVDEVLGQWVTLAGASTLNWKSFLIGFGLFRLFDIWKPWPVRKLEALHGGTGIIADDIAAGIYGAIVLYIAGYFNLY